MSVMPLSSRASRRRLTHAIGAVVSCQFLSREIGLLVVLVIAGTGTVIFGEGRSRRRREAPRTRYSSSDDSEAGRRSRPACRSHKIRLVTDEEAEPLSDEKPRITILLGAGASWDAGLNLTSDLARIVVAGVEGQGPTPPPAVQALNFVYSQMIGYQGEDGDNPLSAVNIETLISALRLLAHRSSHEVAPFVSAWKAGALGFSTTETDPVLARRLDDTVQAVALGGLARATAFPGGLAALIREVTHTGPAPEVFQDAEAEVLLGISSELSNIKTTAYLSPLADLARAQRGGLDVVTLNYDLAIESMASAEGIPLDRGVERWVPGTPLAFDRADGAMNLIKVHGSLDWFLDDARESGWLARPRLQVEDVTKTRKLPWIVVGDREKLATSGPTLALLNSAEVALAKAQRLIVVGYSFGDAHINTMVRDWLNVDEQRTLTVIDPGWIPSQPRAWRVTEDPTIQQALAIMAAQPESVGPSRVKVLVNSAADALPEAILTPHELLPRARLYIVACGEERQIRFRVTNPGVDLFDVRVTAFAKKPEFHVMPLHRADGHEGQPVPNGLAVGDLLKGEHMDFLADDEWDPTAEIEITISGRSALETEARTSVTRELAASSVAS